MTIFIGSDHAGFERKQKVIAHLKTQNTLGFELEIEDVGNSNSDISVDFPDYANLVCAGLNGSNTKNTLGILICGSGQGMAMRANKYSWIRAALCWSIESTALAREHNDANVLCFGSRLVDEATTLKMVETFLKTAFAGGRHQVRVDKISQKA